MRSKRKAKKVLKQYGKAAYKERIRYVNSMIETAPSYVGSISWRHMAKKGLIITAVLILSFALLVVSANALGIKLFNFSFFNKSDHVEIVGNENSEAAKPNPVRFYEAGYVPEGYTFTSEDTFSDIGLNRVYQNSKEEYLYIEQEASDGYISYLDNEDCTVTTETICGMETYIYDYGDLKVYMMQDEKVIIKITGALPAEEFEKIIYGLKLK